MGKINMGRVIIAGLVAGIVADILGFLVDGMVAGTALGCRHEGARAWRFVVE